MTDIHNVVILGSGPAGYTAAVYAARANMKPLLIAGNEPGGQLTTTTEVENFPGFPEGVQGPELMELFRKQAERFGTAFLQGSVDKVDLSKRPFTLHLESGQAISTRALIVATGASAKWLGLESEQRLRNRGVSACATCDGFFFRGKPIAVVGGGDTAMEEAVYLTHFASQVTLIHRRDDFRASKIMADRVKTHPKIKILWDSAVSEVLGDDKAGVTGIQVKNLKTNQVSNLAVDGLFVAIGHQPNTSIFNGQLQVDETGYIVTKPHSTYTSVEGVFAAGDVADKTYRQAISAAGTGCMAAIDAERWLATQG
ncbi:MAG: thioredoxin-disulfide reductase [Deltaproteobacteria bacterium]|nr:thioredoxin-disulfide reductase [Deltaproteobacteria bacterium]